MLPSVVLIRTDGGLGSGVVLDGDGNIVTNAHVAGNATSFQVQLADDPQPRQARLVGSYPAGDLAVIRVDDKSGLKPAPIGDSDKVQVGDVVLAVGNPLGLSSSVTDGIVSATGRAVTEPASQASPGTVLPDASQTSVPVNPRKQHPGPTAGQPTPSPNLAAFEVKVRCRAPTGTQFSCQIRSPEEIGLWEVQRRCSAWFRNGFETVPGGTLFSLHGEIFLKGAAWLLQPILGGNVRRQTTGPPRRGIAWTGRTRFPGAERLGHVVVGAEPQPEDPGFLGAHDGQHQDSWRSATVAATITPLSSFRRPFRDPAGHIAQEHST